MKDRISILNHEISACQLCPRLVKFREHVPIRNQYAFEDPWRKPVPGFGDPEAWLMIIGLAPSAQGGNRTGRIFTGDLSAKFLIGCMHQVGLANQSSSESRNDGLILNGCYLTAAVKCVPPDNKPNPVEIATCRHFLKKEFTILPKIKAVLALGHISLKAYRDFLLAEGHQVPALKFQHGAHFKLHGLPKVYASYHPSPQNTHTGKLTKDMLESLLNQIIDDSLTKNSV